MIRVVAILCCISVLAGCAAFSTLGAPGASGAPSARENRESRQVIELIAYTQRVAALQAEEQQRELNASTQMLSKDRGAYGRVRLALLLALPGTAFNDDTRAAGLLDSLAARGLPNRRAPCSSLPDCFMPRSASACASSAARSN